METIHMGTWECATGGVMETIHMGVCYWRGDGDHTHGSVLLEG